jgi:hypothetical protein
MPHTGLIMRDRGIGMTDKLHSDTQAKIESIVYQPNLQDTGDLEAGTRTITATGEAVGTVNADYSHSLTLSKPGDARLAVKRIVNRLETTIDSMTAGHLYCRVYVDTQDAGQRLFDKNWTSPGAKSDAVDSYTGAIFNLLADGYPHTFYFFFWVDSGNAVVNLVQLTESVGTCSTRQVEVLRLSITPVLWRLQCIVMYGAQVG